MADQPVTREKLINADIDVENIGKAVNEKGVVNPRYGDSYLTLPSAIQKVIETGGFEPFMTEVALLASVPTLSKKAAKALDTKKVWLWDGTKWNDTGLSELDLAKKDIEYSFSDFSRNNRLGLMSQDFHTDDMEVDFLLLAENGDILFSSNEAQKINSLPDWSNDFHTDRDLQDVVVISEDGYILDLSNGFNEDSIGNNQSAELLLFRDGNYLKVNRSNYPDYYYQTSISAVPADADVYKFYDDLMLQHPNHITKKLLGNSTSSRPIYEYEIIPPKKTYWVPITAAMVKPPKIVIISGVHGAERMGHLGTICFISNLMNEWKTLDGYDKLRFGVQFVVIPVANPDGLNNNTRGNGNGVDLNRNFDADWSQEGSSVPTDPFYYGPSVVSEIETQILALIPTQHSDAILFIDHHQGSEAYFYWMGSETEKGRNLCLEVLDDMFIYHQKHVSPNLTNQVVDNMGRFSPNGAGTLARWIQKQGKECVLYESAPSGHSMIGDSWLKARKLSAHGIFTICSKAHQKYLKSQSI